MFAPVPYDSLHSAVVTQASIVLSSPDHSSNRWRRRCSHRFLPSTPPPPTQSVGRRSERLSAFRWLLMAVLSAEDGCESSPFFGRLREPRSPLPPGLHGRLNNDTKFAVRCPY